MFFSSHSHNESRPFSFFKDQITGDHMVFPFLSLVWHAYCMLTSAKFSFSHASEVKHRLAKKDIRPLLDDPSAEAEAEMVLIRRRC